ncbi:MAG: BON domain-containing protein [Humidesulfovibrio sp.]|nr:BON domain-containing protein [Humidesulfovibrio sp.]
MSFLKRLSLLCLTALLALTFGCSSSPTKEGAGEVVDDTAITAKVKADIFQAPTLKSSEINVETFKGVVQLSGFVASQADKDRAAEVARMVPGVKEVRNDVLLKDKTTTSSATMGQIVDDTAITANVKTDILHEPTLKSAEIKVETFKGVVQLSGFVGTQADIAKAGELAGKVNGVKSVRNDMRLKGQQ